MLTNYQNAALRNVLICLLLSVLTFSAFDLILDNDFISFDDQLYVTENNHVLQGLTPKSIAWAFQTTFTGNWIPLTWLTHMLDVELYGVNPKGHHLNNLILHTANALLVFTLFQITTRRPWAAAVAAALFAIHPLRVESVAWVSERKDVLCAFFGLSACISYSLYTRQASGRKQFLLYSITLILLILGLMSKAMLVTWPFLFLVLDFWPLKRFPKTSSPQTENARFSPRKRLFIEKIPFLCLAVLFSVIAFYAQKQHAAVHTFASSPLNLRSANVVVSYGRYLAKMFHPCDLSLLYPLNKGILAAPNVILSSAVMVIISVFCIVWKNKRPYLLAGWLWFLGTLVPVIGIVQIGSQSIADRYTYLPSIGISVMVAFTLGELARKTKVLRIVTSVSIVCILSLLLVLTWMQCAHWKNSRTIFKKAVESTPDSYVMHMNYADVLLSEGEYNEAFSQYQKAGVIRPASSEPCLKCGIIRLDQKKYRQAIDFFETALLKKQEGFTAQIYNNLGIAYSKLNDYAKAVDSFKAAIENKPTHSETYKNLALTLLKDQKPHQAKDVAEKGLALATADENTDLVNWFTEFIREFQTE